MATVATAWTQTDYGHPAQAATQLPEALDVLRAHLTEYGRQVLAEELAGALSSSDPIVAVSRVLSSWWLTMVARHHPGYHEAMSRPSPSPAEAVYETTEELKAKLGL